MRLFIAVNFSQRTKAELLRLRDELRAHSQRGNFSSPDNLHLTLAFLGECDGRQTAAVRAAMTALSFEPFPISINSVGRFRRDGGDIWWAGCAPCKQLLSLQSDLSQDLRTRGFELDNRKYSPHITLGREVISMYSLAPFDPFGETVMKIDLMKSERINGRLTYTPIFSS